MRCSVHLPIIYSLVQCKFSSNCYPGSMVMYICTFAKNPISPLWISHACKVVMYISATRLVNLGLPKTFIQLFHMQVHITYIQAWYDVLFQIGFAILVLTHSQTTCFKVTACIISKTVSLMSKASSLCDSMW